MKTDSSLLSNIFSTSRKEEFSPVHYFRTPSYISKKQKKGYIYLPLSQSEGKFFGQGKKLRQQIIFFNKNK